MKRIQTALALAGLWAANAAHAAGGDVGNTAKQATQQTIRFLHVIFLECLYPSGGVGHGWRRIPPRSTHAATAEILGAPTGK